MELQFPRAKKEAQSTHVSPWHGLVDEATGRLALISLKGRAFPTF